MSNYFWKQDEKVTALLDSERKKRYLLNCKWNSRKPCVTFILLNPSEGNEEKADRTLRRCVNFAKKWGYGSMNVVNLFSQIAKNPDQLDKPSQNEIVQNNKYIARAVLETECVIFGWGELDRRYNTRVKEIKKIGPKEKQFCIKKTSDGLFPRHPLYLSAELMPVPM